MNLGKYLLLGASFCLASCGGDGNSSDTQATWDATIEGLSVNLVFSEILCNQEPDGGVSATLTGTDLSGNDVSVLLDVSGGAPIDFSNLTNNEEAAAGIAIQVGGSALNLRLRVGDSSYLGTSGDITFLSYGTNLGDSIEADVDAGLVSTSFATGGAATLKGRLPSCDISE